MAAGLLFALSLLLVCAVPAAAPRAPQPLDDEAIRAAAARLHRLQSLLVSRRGSLVFEYLRERGGTGAPRQRQVRLQEHHLDPRWHRD